MNMFQAKRLEKYACDLLDEIVNKSFFEISNNDTCFPYSSLMADIKVIGESMVYLKKEFEGLKNEFMQRA